MALFPNARSLFYRNFYYSGKSGITHCGGCIRFFLTASSAISSIRSNDVSLINWEVCAAYSRLGHLSPNTQPLTQASAQLIVSVTITSLKCSSIAIGRRLVLAGQARRPPARCLFLKKNCNTIPLKTRKRINLSTGKVQRPGRSLSPFWELRYTKGTSSNLSRHVGDVRSRLRWRVAIDFSTGIHAAIVCLLILVPCDRFVCSQKPSLDH